MKKFTSIFLALAIFTILIPLSVNAQTRNKKNCSNRTYQSNSNVSRQYRTRGYSQTRSKRKNFYGRHRNAINIGIGTTGGAILGGILGGKKGALIGAGVGAGSGAAYTYGIKPKKKSRYRRN
jgi:outer membrane lipoprotein SlyB